MQQSYQNLEIILVNDGSSDNCGKICDTYAMQDSRVAVIHKENGGLSDARNAGLDICTGEYIAFVDSDDVIHKQFIEILYSNIGDSDMIFCDFLKFAQDSIIEYVQISMENMVVEDYKSSYLISNFMSFKIPLLFGSWNKLYKSVLWEDLRFCKGIVCEDLHIAPYVIARCNVIKFINCRLYYYRLRHDSIMNNKNIDALTKRTLDTLFVCDDIHCFAIGHRIDTLAKEVVKFRIDHSISFYDFLNKEQIPANVLDYINHHYQSFTTKQKIRLFMLKRMKKILFLIRKVRH